MDNNQLTEEGYERTLIELFQELGYEYECGYDMERDFRNPYYEADLKAALRRQNPMLTDEVLDEAFRIVTHVNEGILEQRNETLTDYLQNGVEVKYNEKGRAKTALVRLINYDDPLQNQFKICNQWSVVEHEKIRCDLVVFVNGLPLVVIELKSPRKGIKPIAQGIALGVNGKGFFALQGQKTLLAICFCPFRALLGCAIIPKAFFALLRRRRTSLGYEVFGLSGRNK